MDKRIQKILFLSLSIFLIIFWGYLLFKGFLYLQKRIGEIKNEISTIEDPKTSEIMILALLSPQKNNFEKLKNRFLEEKNYKEAEFINFLSPSDDFSAKTAVAATENRDYKVAEKYLSNIKDKNIIEEINLFIDLSTGDYSAINKISSEPQTDLGKQLIMIRKNNYNLYDNLESPIGKKISSLQKNKPKRTELKIGISELYLKYNLPYFTLAILEYGQEDKNSCIYKEKEIASRAYEMLNMHKEALEKTEEAIACQPTEISLYQKAHNLALVLNDNLKADQYSRAIDFLSQIQK